MFDPMYWPIEYWALPYWTTEAPGVTQDKDLRTTVRYARLGGLGVKIFVERQ